MLKVDPFLKHVFTLYHILLWQDGKLCCSYNLHYADVSRPVGYDGVVAPLPILERHSTSSAIQDQVKDIDFNKQYDATLRVGNGSVGGNVYISDSVEKNKTEKAPGGWRILREEIRLYIPGL